MPDAKVLTVKKMIFKKKGRTTPNLDYASYYRGGTIIESSEKIAVR